LARRSRRVNDTSEDLVDGIDWTFGTTVAGGHSDQAVQKCVRRMCRLESRCGPKVVPGRIDGFAASKGRDDFRRPVAKAERSHRDERAVVSLKGRAKVQFEDAVWPDQ